MGHLRILWRLTGIFIVLKIVQLAIVYFTPVKFDTSSEIIIQQHIQAKHVLAASFPWSSLAEHVLTHIVDKFVTWDAVYFSDLHVNPIKYEHQFVFCPSWWRLIKYIPWGEGNFYSKLVLSLLVSNLLHYLCVVVMYGLTLSYFRNRSQGKQGLQSEIRLAELASVLVILGQAGIFLTGGYSENLSNLLSYLTIYLHDSSLNYSDFRYPNHTSVRSPIKYIASGTLLALNFTVRANSTLLGAIYLIDLYGFLVHHKSVKRALLPMLAGGQLFLSIVAMNVYSYVTFCPGRGEWCNKTIPSLFGYAQSEYWDNGFLKYWTPNNIPNFLFALPSLLIHTGAIFHYYTAAELPKIKKITSLLVVNALFLIGIVFFWNTQILTRVGSFLPLSYWYMAQLIYTNHVYAKYILYYMIGWNLVQTSLFAAFLPPA